MERYTKQQQPPIKPITNRIECWEDGRATAFQSHFTSSYLDSNQSEQAKMPLSK